MGRFGLIVAVIAVSIVAGCSSQRVIRISNRATPTEKYAAAELEKYLEQITGDNYRVARGKGKAGFVVCDQDHLGDLGGASEISDLKSKGTFLVGARGRATLFAVYDYLDAQGCRFLAPKFDHYHGAAEVIPPRGRLSHLESSASPPKLAFRKLYVEEGHSHDAQSLRQLVEWMPKAGYNTLVIPTDYQGSGRVKWDNWRRDLTPELQKRDLIIEVGGHGYQNFLNAEMEDGKLFEQHPEWFGQNKAGVRQRAKGWVICTSNKEAADYLINNFAAYIKARPEIQIYDFWPPDGAKWCECEPCKKLGTPSDRQAILVHEVKQRAKDVRPDLRLEVLAYHTSVMPPENQKLDKDILLDFCPISQQFDHQINDPAADKNAGYAKNVSAWRKAFDGEISIYSYYRKYAWDSLPVVIPHYMQTDLQWYATLPVQGVSVYSEPGDWFTYELNHYVLGKLAWDANADVDALVKKFCDARYGNESQTAQKAFAALEKIVRNDCSVPNSSLKSAEEIAAAQTQMNEVAASVEAARGRTSDRNVKRSLERLQLMCTYAAKDLEVQHMRATKAPVDEIRAKATAAHAWLSEHANDGVFLIKNQRLNLARMHRRYGLPAAEN